MVSRKPLFGFFLCLLTTTVLATTRAPRLRGTELCNLQRLTSSQPARRFEYEGGSIELWDENENKFQCVGVAPERHTIQPNSLLLPNFMPYPRLVFIEQGEGIVGVQFPGCAETFDTGVQQQSRKMGEEGGERDSHQKVHRFYPGDVIVIPAGAIHWAYNDGNQEVVAIAINDINNPANQLDMQPRTFYLAGGGSSQSGQGQQPHRGPWQQHEGRSNFYNIFRGFDTVLLAEVFNADPQIVRAMQEPGDRGFIVKVQQPMQFITPDERQQDQQQQPWQRPGGRSNGLEETICSEKIVYNLDSQREADVFSRQAGKLKYVNEYKLPILSYLDLSAEKGYLQPNAMGVPHWSINHHGIMYVLRGDARVQIVSNNGQTVLDQQVKRGDILVAPQFFASVAKAGQNGLEWVAFKTNASPMKTPIVGYTGVFGAMPLEVITNAYQISPSQAQELKTNRGTESMLLSPLRTTQRS